MDSYYDFLKQKLSNIDTGDSELDRIIYYIPEVFRVLCDLLDKDEVAKDDRIMINAALGYFVTPSDILPEEAYGPYGYIDDMYVSCVVLKRMGESYGTLVHQLWNNDIDYNQFLESTIKRCEQFLDDKGLKEKTLRYCGLSD